MPDGRQRRIDRDVLADGGIRTARSTVASAACMALAQPSSTPAELVCDGQLGLRRAASNWPAHRVADGGHPPKLRIAGCLALRLRAEGRGGLD